MQTTKENILEYLKELKPTLAKDGIKKIGLFGSYAKDEVETNSDIDIVVLVNKQMLVKKGAFKTAGYFNALKDKISNKFNKSVDLCSIFSQENLDRNKDFFKGAIYV
ncbi:nucleotidyltransferase domain-containing protein [Campylobacter sp. RM9344]|uniref:Nucleotidyltransferase domain-containing protein n=1 Tax=Campylobacter californiensis TaxID=1032243 RepID=A0AAW3ZTJ8_9BACT|nr:MULTISPECIES: nucleotidyltransferase domain-containing protein [unclassified Campylobacter]MBE2984088.1 nucleotidyltransferase domain-containing protein [Campylobacter sp. RM6883]MBE2995750.1 nucleotidyltransferase domain-containing protein [Campylobacter sp. RM6913]MBE3029857.1 nucleotidyltransferase domain-containing protein [Campylobacter sp. RM9344]MBE3607857.1 nucleotidyltransferase domain-containing protein [Campylobacter sp. RM9337]QCD51464.1 nucleotidyl transferase domain protein [C